ncbi:MAG: STAS domain-containing protein [Candidatus Cloacimonadota bacterium]|nr:STAS domain-containing protein [Candidatus Cloacimonadota bacterium]
MKIQFYRDGKVGIIKIIGRLDAANSRELKEKFQEFLEEVVFFVMDFSELEFIDSTGLGAVISSFKHASEMGGEVYIADLQPKPRMVFNITRAYKIFEVFDDVDAAISAIKEITK